MSAIVTLQPLINVTENDVYRQFHSLASDCGLNADGTVYVQVGDLQLWLQSFNRTYADGSGDCQRYSFISAVAD